MIKKVLIGLVLVIALLFGYASTLPSEMKISRELLIRAKPEAIYPYINHSRKMNEWMPWSESDPEAKMLYSGPELGIGSTTSWDSKGNMGTGQAVIVESIPNRSVKTQLTYTKPMKMEQLAEVSLTPAEGGTVVRWSVNGHSPLISRIFCIFMDVDKTVGGEFEKGLANLKRIVEPAQ